MTALLETAWGVIAYLVGSLTWINALFLFGVIYAVFLLRRMHSDPDNTYDIRDVLLDHRTNRASVDSHILVGMAVLAGWSIVSMVIAGKEVENLLLGVLGIFIVGREAKRGINAWKPPPPAEGAPDFQRTTTTETEKVTVQKDK